MVLAVCAEPGWNPAAPEISGDTVAGLNGDAIEGWHVGAVAADGGDDDDDEDQYTCFDPEDCWKKCPLKSRDGSSVTCECSKNKSGSGWTCDVKNGFIDGGGGGDPGETGCGGSSSGNIGSGTLEKCQELKMPVEMTCNSSVNRGEKARCEALPLNPSHNTRKTKYTWSAECFLVTNPGLGNQCTETRKGKGRGYQTWSGRASTSATIKVKIIHHPNDSVLYVGGGSRKVTVHGRYWTTGHLKSNASMEYPENPPKGPPWKKGSWGAFNYSPQHPPLPSMSTKSGSGPWKGTHYLKKEPNTKLLWDYLYVHPDLTYDGPLYPGAESTCGANSPDVPNADLERVNHDCGTESEWSDWKTRVESHERAHQRSYNQCVTGGLSSTYMYLLERLAGKKSDWRREMKELWDDMWLALDVAAETPQREPPTPVMYHYRYPNNKWNLNSYPVGHHSGWWGC